MSNKRQGNDLSRAVLTINLGAIADNFRNLLSRLAPACQAGAVVKANAYGLGFEEVSKALAKAVKGRFGRQVLIQRCRLHKERNIQKYLPKKYHKLLAMKLRAAWGMTDYQEAKKQLYKVHDWLVSINQAAARSLDEGFEETLAVNRLGLPEQLSRLFSSTNIIESCFSLADDLCHNVKRWRDANMAWRWAGTVLLEVEKRFHRVKGYRDLPMLVEKLKEGVDQKEAVA